MDKNRYILVADGGSAKIYKTQGRPDVLETVLECSNPDGRHTNSEIVSDRAGMQQSGSGGYHSMAGDDDASRHAEQAFAADLMDYLRHARQQHAFDHLLIAAPPKFLGDLRRHMGKECSNAVEKEIAKDLVRASDKELLAQFFGT